MTNRTVGREWTALKEKFREDDANGMAVRTCKLLGMIDRHHPSIMKSRWDDAVNHTVSLLVRLRRSTRNTCRMPELDVKKFAAVYFVALKFAYFESRNFPRSRDIAIIFTNYGMPLRPSQVLDAEEAVLKCLGWTGNVSGPGGNLWWQERPCVRARNGLRNGRAG